MSVPLCAPPGGRKIYVFSGFGTLYPFRRKAFSVELEPYKFFGEVLLHAALPPDPGLGGFGIGLGSPRVSPSLYEPRVLARDWAPLHEPQFPLRARPLRLTWCGILIQVDRRSTCCYPTQTLLESVDSCAGREPLYQNSYTRDKKGPFFSFLLGMRRPSLAVR